MNKESEKYLENALRMGRELMHAGAKSTAREGESEAATFSMDAGSALLRLCYMAAKMSATITELRLHVLDQGTLISEKDEEISRLNTRLNDMAGDLNKAAARECELEEILDDTEKSLDSLRAEHDWIRRDYVIVLEQRDRAMLRNERTRRDIDALIAKYS